MRTGFRIHPLSWFKKENPLVWSQLAVLIALVSGWASASELESVNLTQLSHFWARAEARSGPISVVAFGDSLQAPARSFGGQLHARLRAQLGVSGYSLNGRAPYLAVPEFLDGAFGVPPDSLWWLPSYQLPPGAAIRWHNETHPTGSLFADRVGVYFLASPSGGAFSLSVSSNGGAWSWLADISTHADQVACYHTNLSVAPGLYSLKLTGFQGKVRILGPELFNSQSTGIKSTTLALDGLNLIQFLSVPTNILESFFRELQPNFINWHMKEYADIGALALSNRLEELESLIRRTTPETDVLYVGTPYEQRDTTNDFTPTQNRIVRAHAVRHGRAYFDAMNPFVSYEYMVEHGYLDDALHPSNACYERMAELAWDELGFFALGHSRKVWMTRMTDGFFLQWKASSGISYQVESTTTDWSTWSTGPTYQLEPARNEGPLQHPLPEGAQGFFRLRLLPAGADRAPGEP